MNDQKSWVYWISNSDCTLITESGYVGVSLNPQKRFKQHLRQNKKIPSDKELLLTMIFHGSRVECYDMEKTLRPSRCIGWNNAVGGIMGYKLGFAHSEETKKKIKASWTEERKAKASIRTVEQNHKLLGQKRPTQSDAMSGKNNFMFGKKHSEVAKMKMREGRKGIIPANRVEYHCIECHKRSSPYIIKKYHIKCFKSFYRNNFA